MDSPLATGPASFGYTTENPRITYVRERDSRLRAVVVDLMERLLGRGQVQRLYERIKSGRFEPRTFFGLALEAANIRVDMDPGSEARIPRSGPLIFIANHPFGVVDGTILCDLAARTRGEFKILINAMLCRDQDLASYFLPVDFADTTEAMRNNINTKRAALETLRNDGTILIFPSGGVSTARRFGFGPLQDLPWTTFAAKLVQQSRAGVVPVFFHGGNSRVFHIASHLHESLRTGLFIREARRQFGKTVHLKVGEPISYEAISHLTSRRALTDYLYHRTWELGAAARQRAA